MGEVMSAVDLSWYGSPEALSHHWFCDGCNQWTSDLDPVRQEARRAIPNQCYHCGKPKRSGGGGHTFDLKCDDDGNVTAAQSRTPKRDKSTPDKKSRSEFGRYRYVHHCEMCGAEFRSNRCHARTCSDVCRKRLSRKAQ